MAKSWNNARSTCQAEGGDLMVLNTPAIINYMQTQLAAGTVFS